MLELIQTENLDASTLRIWRVKTDAPTSQAEAARFLRFIQGTTGLENPRNSRRDLSYWRIYFHSAFAGRNYPEVVDYFYFAEVDGQIAARLWFAFAPANGFGNFGNILTLPEFRRRGILRRLMEAFVEDFKQCPARCVACATGTPFAARTYMDYGFRLLYPGTAGAMALVKGEYGSFHKMASVLFAEPSPVRMRPGVLGDQFRIDKFLRYIQAFHDEGPKSQLMDYRCCMQEVLGGNGSIAIFENAVGAAAGFAWAGNIDSLHRMTFLLHPAALKDAGRFLREFCRKDSEPSPVFIQETGDERSPLWLSAAGGRRRCVLANGAALWEFGD